MAFGQEVAVTPLQMLNAFGAIANNGQMMMPQLVRPTPHTFAIESFAQLVDVIKSRQMKIDLISEEYSFSEVYSFAHISCSRYPDFGDRCNAQCTYILY